MTDPTSVDEQLQQAELERRRAEAAKYQAEKQQIDTERQHLEEEQRRPWYRRKYALQSLGAGIFLGPFVWFYLTQVALPISRREVIDARLKNAELRDSLRVQAIVQDSVRRTQSAAAARHEEDHADILAQNQRLSTVRANLEEQLQTLSSVQAFTQRERDSLAVVLQRSGSFLTNQAWELAFTGTFWQESVDEAFSTVTYGIQLNPAGNARTIMRRGSGEWSVSGDSLTIRIDGMPRRAFALASLDPDLPLGVILRGRYSGGGPIWIRLERKSRT